jgi:cytochrome b561
MKYPLAIRILHWLIAFIIIGLLIAGLIMTGMEKDNPNRSLLYSLHKSFGVTIIFLAVLRLTLRLWLGTPPLPSTIPAQERRLAHFGHWGFYLFMFGMPITGYMLSNSFGLSVHWFGVNLPRLFDVDRARGEFAANLHEYGAYTLIGLITLHVAGVIKHGWKERINLLSRMW